MLHVRCHGHDDLTSIGQLFVPRVVDYSKVKGKCTNSIKLSSSPALLVSKNTGQGAESLTRLDSSGVHFEGITVWLCISIEPILAELCMSLLKLSK